MNQKIKISDIAEQSGVSSATVSLVLNNKPGVSQDTRTKVLAVCEELGYPVQISSSANGTGRVETIGMLVKTEPDELPQANPFYSQVIAGIEQACRKRGINLLYATMPVDENNRPTEVPALLGNRTVDGLLMVGTFLDETIESIRGYKLPPLVLVDGYSHKDNYDMVVSDNFTASYRLVEYLLAKGHKKIALVGGEANAYPSLSDRRNGYLRALKDNGITDTYFCEFNIGVSKGHPQIRKFLDENREITAVFGINDQTAVDVIRIAQELEIAVPADLSVVGYDNTYLATTSHPQLTTMWVDTVSMGQAAVNMLAFRVDQPDASRMTLTIHPTLVERGSVQEKEKDPNK